MKMYIKPYFMHNINPVQHTGSVLIVTLSILTLILMMSLVLIKLTYHYELIVKNESEYSKAYQLASGALDWKVKQLKNGPHADFQEAVEVYISGVGDWPEDDSFDTSSQSHYKVKLTIVCLGFSYSSYNISESISNSTTMDYDSFYFEITAQTYADANALNPNGFANVTLTQGIAVY